MASCGETYKMDNKLHIRFYIFEFETQNTTVCLLMTLPMGQSCPGLERPNVSVMLLKI